MSSAHRHRNGTARAVAISCLISSLATSADVAQKGNMLFAAMSVVQRLQRGIPIGKTVHVAGCGHGSCPLQWGSVDPG